MRVNNDIKISVVTVCYNAEKTIEATIKSVLNQSYCNVEYIIIDGGSTDGTIEIIKKYSDKVTYWISEPDNGIYDAMNKGISMALGDFILFIGSDDTIFDCNVLLNVANFIGNNRNSVFYGDVILSPKDIRYAGRFSKWTLVQKNICHQAIFYPTDILKNNLYDLRYRSFSDYNENMILWGKGIPYTYMPLIISKFKTGGVSAKGDEEFETQRGRIIRNSLGLTAYIYYLLRRCCSNIIK